MSAEFQLPADRQYLRQDQKESMRREVQTLEKQIRSDFPHGGDRNLMRQRKEAIERTLATESAPEINPAQREAIAREAKRLEERFTPSMPSGEEMRKNPPGAVGKNLRWHQRHKHDVARWKNAMRLLDPGNPDAPNVERLRKHRTPGDLSMEGAQITGTAYVGTTPTEEYKEGWERTFGDGESPDTLGLSAPDSPNGQHPAASPAPRGSKPPQSASREAPEKVYASCGKPIDKRGVKNHERHCPSCQEIGEAAGASE